jgi:pyridoxal phosphate enzyme (YggS family)
MSNEPDLGMRLASVRSQIVDAALTAGREPSSITTIIVTKFQPISLVRELLDLGERDFGENRHQEASEKSAVLEDSPARWHFVGQLQSNKAKAVRAYASVVHSVDRESLVPGLSAPAVDHPNNVLEPLDVFVQVDLGTEPGRGGVVPAALDALVERVVAASGITLVGLMTVAPLETEPRRAFARLRELAEGVRRTVPGATSLSMGMSGDFIEAIMEGATHLRLGSAITGNRPVNG